MLRIGHGFDVHAFAEGRALILGGVRIDAPKGLLGHSDADVVAHALMDALLGAMRAKDILCGCRLLRVARPRRGACPRSGLPDLGL